MEWPPRLVGPARKGPPCPVRAGLLVLLENHPRHSYLFDSQPRMSVPGWSGWVLCCDRSSSLRRSSDSKCRAALVLERWLTALVFEVASRKAGELSTGQARGSSPLQGMG